MSDLIPAPSLESLSTRVGTSVVCHRDDAAPVPLRIASIERSPSQEGYESFSVLLEGPASAALSSGIYRVKDDTLGPFDLCLNPTWANHGNPETWEYEAVFNRAVDSEAKEAVEASALQETSSRRGFFSRVAAAAAGGGIIAGLFGNEPAQARTTERPAGASGAPLAYEPLIGGIGMFGGNFAPRNWANCDGQLLAISQNSALFSILGTMYGGDGRTTFAVPDLRGRVPIHAGQGPGLSSRPQAQRGGSETTTLNATQIPNHSHPSSLPVTSAEGDAISPDGNALGAQPNSRGTQPIYSTNATDGTMNVDNAAVGGSQPHDNMPPFTVIRYVIALVGVFPSRS